MKQSTEPIQSQGLVDAICFTYKVDRCGGENRCWRSSQHSVVVGIPVCSAIMSKIKDGRRCRVVCAERASVSVCDGAMNTALTTIVAFLVGYHSRGLGGGGDQDRGLGSRSSCRGKAERSRLALASSRRRSVGDNDSLIVRLGRNILLSKRLLAGNLNPTNTFHSRYQQTWQTKLARVSCPCLPT